MKLFKNSLFGFVFVCIFLLPQAGFSAGQEGNLYEAFHRAHMKTHRKGQQSDMAKELMREEKKDPVRILQYFVNQSAFFAAFEDRLRAEETGGVLGLPEGGYRTELIEADIATMLVFFNLERPNPTPKALALALEIKNSFDSVNLQATEYLLYGALCHGGGFFKTSLDTWFKRYYSDQLGGSLNPLSSYELPSGSGAFWNQITVSFKEKMVAQGDLKHYQEVHDKIFNQILVCDQEAYDSGSIATIAAIEDDVRKELFRRENEGEARRRQLRVEDGYEIEYPNSCCDAIVVLAGLIAVVFLL